jgi:hypothetical protein
MPKRNEAGGLPSGLTRTGAPLPTKTRRPDTEYHSMSNATQQFTTEYLKALTTIELAYLLQRQSERRDIHAFAAVQAIAREIKRRAEAERR